MRRKVRPIKLKALASISVIILATTAVYMLFKGVDYFAGAIFTVAFLSLGGPSAIAGNSALEVLTEILGMLIEGVMTILEGIFTAIGSIFS